MCRLCFMTTLNPSQTGVGIFFAAGTTTPTLATPSSDTETLYETSIRAENASMLYSSTWVKRALENLKISPGVHGQGRCGGNGFECEHRNCRRDNRKRLRRTRLVRVRMAAPQASLPAESGPMCGCILTVRPLPLIALAGRSLWSLSPRRPGRQAST